MAAVCLCLKSCHSFVNIMEVIWNGKMRFCVIIKFSIPIFPNPYLCGHKCREYCIMDIVKYWVFDKGFVYWSRPFCIVTLQWFWSNHARMPVFYCLVWGGIGQGWACLAQLVRCVTLVPKVQGFTPTSG